LKHLKEIRAKQHKGNLTNYWWSVFPDHILRKDDWCSVLPERY
jgi:hypothetical protein